MRNSPNKNKNFQNVQKENLQATSWTFLLKVINIMDFSEPDEDQLIVDEGQDQVQEVDDSICPICGGSTYHGNLFWYSKF